MNRSFCSLAVVRGELAEGLVVLVAAEGAAVSLRVLSGLTCRSGLPAASPLRIRGRAVLLLCKEKTNCAAAVWEMRQAPRYLWSSEQDGLAGCFLLHVRGKALEELGVLALGHCPEH